MKVKNVILVLIILSVIIIVFQSVNWRSGNTMEKITITGNYTIPKEEILEAARLRDTVMSYEEINIDNIQDRISKHPEIKKVYVSMELPSELKIEIIERRPVAILNGENEIKLIDDELEIFPFKNASKMYDLPVISGVRIENTPNPVKKYNKDDLRLAVFIILNAYKESKAAYNNISEVNLSDTSKSVVYLSEDSSPFYFPRKYRESISNKEYQTLLINKLVLFENYLKQKLDSHLKKQVNYVDLRFDNEVIINSNN